jgi:NAD(P)-dependent dehydrogenase (short-subunit alcohol dehydrogenase family)
VIVTRTVLITGTSSGIGKAAVKLFAASGWNVVATMRKPEAETELNSLAAVLMTRPGRSGWG